MFWANLPEVFKKLTRGSRFRPVLFLMQNFEIGQALAFNTGFLRPAPLVLKKCK
jgi:hypothetical protein